MDKSAIDIQPTSVDSHSLLMPFVSVIVTAHNYVRFIGECVASIRSQTYQHFECLVVDDASTDGTRALLDQMFVEWGDQRFAVISTTKNLGQLGAQALGLQKTSSEFVVYVDADDLLHENFLERHIFAHLHCEAAVAFTSSDQWTINAKGTILSFHHTELHSRLYSKLGKDVTITHEGYKPMQAVVLPWQDTRVASADWLWGTQSTMMFRRQFLDLIMPDPVPEHAYRICSDYYLVRFAQLVGGSLILREALGSYRRHGGNNFSTGSLVGARLPSGDNRKHPPFTDFCVLARSVLTERLDRFTACLGTGHQTQVMIWLQLSSMAINPEVVFGKERTEKEEKERELGRLALAAQVAAAEDKQQDEAKAMAKPPLVTLLTGLAWPLVILFLGLLAFFRWRTG